jgi:hypothetical protein
VETTVETAVIFQGLAHRKTMKRPRSIHWLSSKENEENTDQAMAINAARSPRRRARRASGENIGDTPKLETPQPHRLLCRLSGRLRVTVSAGD